MQIRLTKSNERKLIELLKRWKKTASPDRPVNSPTAIVNSVLHVQFDEYLKK